MKYFWQHPSTFGDFQVRFVSFVPDPEKESMLLGLVYGDGWGEGVRESFKIGDSSFMQIAKGKFIHYFILLGQFIPPFSTSSIQVG